MEVLKRALADTPLAGEAWGNATWLLAEKAVRLLLGLAVGAWVARYLGPDQFGALSYALALVALAAIIANAGLDTVVVREIARDPARRDALLGSAFVIKLAGGMVAFACALGAAFALRDPDGALPWLVLPAALALVFQAFDTVDLWFQSQLKARRAVLARNAAFLAAAAFKVALVLLAAPLWAFAWAVLLEAVLAAVALAMAYHLQRERLFDWYTDTARVSLLLREGWQLMLAGFMVAVYMRIDQVMLGAMAGAEAVGVYSAAVFLSEPWYFVAVAIVSSAAPALARWREADADLYERRFIQLFRGLLLVSAAMALAVSLGAGALVRLAFGGTFEAAAPVLAVHAWATLFVALGVGSGQYLVLAGLARVSLQRTLAGAVVNIALNLLWIPKYGALGCAWATLVSYATATFFLFHTPATRHCLLLMLRALWPARA